jgi:Fe-S cluster biogenesis protein NfuA
VLDRELVDDGGAVAFDARTAVDVSPLASPLLAIEGVDRVLIGSDFVTVTKSAESGWREVGQEVDRAIRSWAESGEPVLGEGYASPEVRRDREPDDEIVARIRRILDEEIGPYVAQDGGEISLVGFEAGVVQVVLRGACQSCPSSTITLKMGIEARLREQIPEVLSVVAVER